MTKWYEIKEDQNFSQLHDQREFFSRIFEGKKLDIPISFWTAFMFPLNLLWWFLST